MKQLLGSPDTTVTANDARSSLSVRGAVARRRPEFVAHSPWKASSSLHVPALVTCVWRDELGRRCTQFVAEFPNGTRNAERDARICARALARSYRARFRDKTKRAKRSDGGGS